jgi:hypothetical protein
MQQGVYSLNDMSECSITTCQTEPSEREEIVEHRSCPPFEPHNPKDSRQTRFNQPPDFVGEALVPRKAPQTLTTSL